MNILFLNPPYFKRYSRNSRSPAVTKSGTLYYPVWLSYAAGTAEHNGYRIKLVDAVCNNLKLKDILKMVSEFKPEIIVSDTSTPSIYNDVEVISKIKRSFPESLTILAGTHTSALPEETLRLSNYIDVVCIGEYELTILNIAKSLENGTRKFDGISGVCYREGEDIRISKPPEPIQDLDGLPFLNRTFEKHLNYRKYFYSACHYPVTVLITSRGCAYRCNFCLYPQTLFKGGVRKRSLKNIFEELSFIKNHMPDVREIVIEDDTFTFDLDRVKIFCEHMLQKEFKFYWSCNARADLDFATLELMKRAGCRLLFVGFENASDRILKDMNKELKVEQTARFLRDTRKVGILVHAAFIIGNIGETEHEIKATIKFAKELEPDTAQFFPLIPYPGTRLYSELKEKKLLKSDNFSDWLTVRGYHNSVIDQPNMNSTEVIKYCKKARKTFYFRPYYILKKILLIISRPDELFRILRGFSFFWRHII